MIQLSQTGSPPGHASTSPSMRFQPRRLKYPTQRSARPDTPSASRNAGSSGKCHRHKRRHAQFKKLQVAGAALFEEALKADAVLWAECEQRWGAGPRYRDDIVRARDGSMARAANPCTFSSARSFGQAGQRSSEASRRCWSRRHQSSLTTCHRAVAAKTTSHRPPMRLFLGTFFPTALHTTTPGNDRPTTGRAIGILL